ncbi:hypothetical protein OAH46_01130 [Verrucomicrobia bacterium]|nr:hypothetical protein [Verrucomicrobiota bacterium]
MKKCPKCNYLRTADDDNFTPETECPLCGVVYAKFNSIKKDKINIPEEIPEQIHETSVEVKNVVNKKKHQLSKLISRKKSILPAFVIILLTTSVLLILSYKNNDPCNKIMELSTDSTIEELTETRENISTISDKENLQLAIDHVTALDNKHQKDKDGSEEWRNKQASIIKLKLRLYVESLLLTGKQE